MKAVRIDAFGGPETLVYGDVAEPRPGPGEILVRVRACALNHLDLWVREGIPAYKIRLPHVLGNDIAGEVAGLGPGASAAIGSKVVVFPGRSCWTCAFCKAGRDNLCESYGILGANGGWGGYAEFAVVPAGNLFPMPASLTFEEAASFPLTFLTAAHMLETLAGVQSGQTVLVLGAGSGVGVAAIQIAKHLGARVLAASTSAEKLARAKALGADALIHSPPEDLYRQALRLTEGAGVDAVFEHVGPAVLADALRCLRPGGALVTCGATTGPTAEIDLRYLFSRELRILGARMGTLAEFRKLVPLFDSGRLRPVVGRTFPLKEARAAQEYLADRRQFGKVVLSL